MANVDSGDEPSGVPGGKVALFPVTGAALGGAAFRDALSLRVAWALELMLMGALASEHQARAASDICERILRLEKERWFEF